MSRKQSGLILALVVSVMAFWKTVLYMIQYTPYCKDSKTNLDHLKLSELLFFFIIPSGVWLVVPFFCILHFSKSLMNAIIIPRTEDQEKKKLH